MSFFERYPEKGKKFLGQTQGATARHDYGPQVAAYSGWACAYCGRELLSSYEAWLDLQIDHVIPYYLIKRGLNKKWVLDIANCVVCCSACNGFLNAYKVNEEDNPLTEEDFFELRNNVFVEKKKRAQERHEEERKYWQMTLSSKKSECTKDA
jgi:hypothetical protein